MSRQNPWTPRIFCSLLLCGAGVLTLGCPADEETAATAGENDDSDDDETSGSGTSASGTSGASNVSMTSAGEVGGEEAGEEGGEVGSEGGEAGSEAGEEGGEEGGFITPPDGGIAGQCDPAAQDCPKGQKCTSYVSTPGGATVDATKCVELMGDGSFGEQCTRMEDNDDCAAGFFCMTDVSGNTGEGFCLEYCTLAEPCEFGGECFAFNDGALPVCEVTCDPLAPSCPNGQGCYAAFSSFVCAIPGVGDEGGADGANCSTIQSCNPGLICRGGTAGCVADGGCCTPYCEIGGPSACTEPSEECIAALDDPPPGLAEVGYCGVPA